MKHYLNHLVLRHRFPAPFLILVCAIGFSSPSHGQALFDSGLDGSGTTNLGDGRNGKTVGFTIGSQSYELQNIQLHLDINHAARATASTVFQIFSDDGSGHPSNTSLLVFDTPDFVQLGSDGADLNSLIITLTPDSSFTLVADTTYWFTAYNTDTNGSTDDIRWYHSGDQNVNIAGDGSLPDPSAYYSVSESELTTPAVWDDVSGVYNDMVVNAVPEPAATTAIFSVFVSVLTLLRRRKWRRA